MRIMKQKQQGTRPPEAQSFHIVIHPRPGLTLRQERQLDRDLADYLCERGLIAQGTSLRMTIHAEERETGLTDQVDLIRWLLTQAPVCGVHVERLGLSRGGRQPTWISATHSDKAIQPLLELYGLGRIDASTAVKVIEGLLGAELSISSPYTAA